MTGTSSSGGIATSGTAAAAFASVSHDNNDEDEQQYSAGPVYQERIQIPVGSAAYVIGKSGVNVKRMRQMGTQCTVKDTVVFIKGNSRQQVQQAKKIVQELLKSYMTRKQTQVNTLNVLSVDEKIGSLDELLSLADRDAEEFKASAKLNKKKGSKQQNQQQVKGLLPAVRFEEREGPLSTFEKVGEEKTYFRLNWDVSGVDLAALHEQLNKEDVEKDEDDGEEDLNEQLAALAMFKKGGQSFDNAKPARGDSSSAAAASADSAAQSHLEEAGLVQKFDITNDEVIRKQALQTMAHKLHEQKQRQVNHVSVKKQPNKLSLNCEVVLGHKLFFLNSKPLPGAVPEQSGNGDEVEQQEAQVPRAQKQQLPNELHQMPIRDLLNLKIGYNQQLNSMFNSALTEMEIESLKNKLKEESSFKLTQKQLTLFVQVSQHFTDQSNKRRRRRYDLQCLVDLPVDASSEQSNLQPLIINRTSDKNVKLMVIDVTRTQSKFDYRMRAKLFHIDNIVDEEVAKLIEEQLCYDVNEHKLMRREDMSAEEDKFTYKLEYRRRIEEIFSNGKIKILFREKKEEETKLSELKNRADRLKQKKNEDGEDEEEAHCETGAVEEDVEEDEEENVVEEERRKMNILEVTLFSEAIDNYGDGHNIVPIKVAEQQEGEEKEQEVVASTEQTPASEDADPAILALQQTPESDIAAMLVELHSFANALVN